MNKSILLATTDNSSFLSPIRKTLIRQGYKVFFFDYRKPNISTRFLGFTSNLLSHGKLYNLLILKKINEQFLATVNALQPDYVFVIKGEVFSPATIRKISKKTITFNWFPDGDDHWEMLIKSAPHYTYYFSVCRFLTKKLLKYKVKAYYLPLAGEADSQKNRITKKYNLVFIGHMTDHRIELLTKITCLGFDLWGYPHWKNSLLRTFYHGQVSPEQVKSIYREAKIVINIPSQDKRSMTSDIANLRNFEATGVGAMVLAEYNSATASLFKNNKEMVFFHNKEELYVKSNYYLSNSTKRSVIANKGWQKLKLEHTYDTRISQLFNIINNSV